MYVFSRKTPFYVIVVKGKYSEYCIIN